MVNSMDKGRRFERQIAKILSQWWDRTNDSVRRTPLSGGFPRKGALGDIICVNHQLFPFYVSIKKVNKWTLDQLIYTERNPIYVWLSEVRSNYYDYITGTLVQNNKAILPILIASKNNRPPIVVVYREDFGRLANYYPELQLSRLLDLSKVLVTRIAIIIDLKLFLVIMDKFRKFTIDKGMVDKLLEDIKRNWRS